MNCPGSAKLCASVPRRTTVWSDEGNAAHNLLETCLKQGIFPAKLRGQKDPEFKKFTYTMEMCDHIMVPLEYAWERTKDPHPEEEVRLKECDQPGKPSKGFVDMWWIEGTTLVIADLKYGAGVLVYAEENEQMMGYAIAVMRKHAAEMRAHKVDRVRLVIIQPRGRGRGPVDTWECSPQRLKDFIFELVEKRDLALSDNAPLVPGDKQCQFCDAKAVCPKLAEQSLAAAQLSFKDLIEAEELHASPTMTPEDIARILPKLPLLRSWINGVETYALSAGLSGSPPPGYKVVQTVPKSKWTDDEELLRELFTALESEFDLPLDEYAPRRPVGQGDLIAAIRETTGQKPKAIKEFIKKYTVKGVGNPTLAPLDDKREEYKPANIMFADLISEDE